MAVKVKQHKGKWWVFIDHKGKRKAKCIGKSEKAAKEVAGKIEARLKLGDFSPLEEEKTLILFADYAAEWLRSSVAARCKPSTGESYKQILTVHLSPACGTLALRDISREAIKRLLSTKREKGLSRARAHVILAVLQGILGSAVEDGHLENNPAARLGRHLGKPSHKEIFPLTREELRLFLETARAHSPAYCPLFLTLARAGMRLGEALALQWPDIDFHGGFIEVRRNMRKQRVDTPKSGKRRTVDMSPQLAATLGALFEERKAQAWQRGWGEVPEWVFAGRDGKPPAEPTVRHFFHAALHKAGIRRIRIHDFRHTFASLLLQNGESLAYVKDQLGHASIRMTIDVYGHLVPGGNRRAVARLDDPQPPATNATGRNPRATSPETAVLEASVSPQ